MPLSRRLAAVRAAVPLATLTFALLLPAQRVSAQRASDQRASAQSTASGERIFYYVDRESSWESFAHHVDQIDIVGPQSYSMDSLGIVFGDVDHEVIALARQHGVKVMPLVVNESFNQAELHKLLTDSTARTRAIDALVELCRRNGYWGIQFDVENVSITDRDRYTAFYTAAAKALHAAGYTVSIAIVPRDGDLAGPTAYNRWIFDSWRGGYDLAALGRVSDFVSWMSYDEHTRRTPPGPVAGLPWMRDGVAYALKFIPASKLSVGTPLYGDAWSVQADPSTPLRAGVVGTGVSYAWGAHLIERSGGTIQWDDVQKSSFGVAPVGGVNTWVFLSDARSFAAQTALIPQFKLRGFSAWVLGMEDPRIWDALPARR